MTALQGKEADIPYTVLVVEDDADDRALYRRLLGSRYNIEEAATASEGLARAKDSAADCIIIDQMLPDGEGLSLIESLTPSNGEAGPAIIMVTGKGDEKTAASAIKSGALDYLPKKDVTETSIRRSIDNAVAKNRLHKEALQARAKLEKSLQGLSEFAHTASHDLKAPLRHIISYCQMLQDDFAKELGESGGRYASRLVVNAQRLQRLVDDLLTYSESRVLPEEKQPLDFNAAMRETLEYLEEAISDAGAKIETGNLPSLNVYPLHMKRLLMNLISNALKYKGAEPPRVTVTCNDLGDAWQFSVTDNGLGIDPDHMDQIFEPFKRLHSRDQIEGSGLGLSICRDIVEMHGGRLWAESTPGAGSTFHFTLPKQ